MTNSIQDLKVLWKLLWNYYQEIDEEKVPKKIIEHIKETLDAIAGDIISKNEELGVIINEELD